MSNAVGLHGHFGIPIYVDYMCTDEFCFFFRCRTADENVLVIKVLMIGSFHNDLVLTAMLRKSYARKVIRCVRQLSRIRPHPSVVRLNKSYELFGSCSVTTEFHQGGNLFNWLADQTHVTLWTLCQVIQCICIGLDYLHRNGIFHGNLGFRNVLFKSVEPNSVAIVLDVSVRAVMDKLCFPYVYDLDRCPPELFDSVCQIAVKWPPASGRSYRTKEEMHVIQKLLQPTRERDMWCVGVMAHQLLVGTGPYTHIKPTDRSAFWQRSQKAILTHSMLDSYSRGICDQLEGFLHPIPLLRSSAEDGARDSWFDDEQTRSDRRNLLQILEYNYMQMEFTVYRDAIRSLNCLRIR